MSTAYEWTAGEPHYIGKETPVVYQMGNLRVVDLTKRLDPDTEKRRCRLWRFNTGGYITDFHTMMDLTSHLGTHCECPYHHNDDWTDVSSLPLTHFMGRALYVNFSDKPENYHLLGKDLEEKIGNRIQDGDVIILDSPHKLPAFTPATNGPDDHRLTLGEDCAKWLAKYHVKCVGFGEGISIEDSLKNCNDLHDILMAQDCTFLEVIQNLEYLSTDEFFINFAPLPIVGLDSCPVRVYAIEGLTEFSKK